MEELTLEQITTRIKSLAEPLLAQAGVDLIELKVGAYRKDIMIQVTADKPLGGITIDECSTLNRRLVEAIDAHGFLPEDCFSLEFCSAGLDRPLTTRKDFLRNLDAPMRLYFHEGVLGKKEMNVVLASVAESTITVLDSKKNELVIPLANILRGMLII